MPRSATTTDAFNAIAEVRRRQILELLSDRERSVGELVDSLGVAQPRVSKHLRVLREVGLVDVRGSGRHRLYRLNAENLRPVHEWVRTFERFWTHKLERIQERAERMAREREKNPNPNNERHRE